MAGPAPTAQAVMALLERGDRAGARQALNALLAARPRDAQAWVAAAWVEHAAGNFPAMRNAADQAGKFGAPNGLCELFRAVAANGVGQVHQAIEHAERASRTAPDSHRLLADTVLAESLFYAHRTEDLAKLLASKPALRDDPRGQLMQARVHRQQGRPAEAEAAYRAVTTGKGNPRTVRIAGFELARLLDSQKRYAEAFEAARAVHAATGRPFDTTQLVREVEATAALAARGAFAGMRRAPGPLPPTALICALPRSGTSLIEQMLDRHPGIAGIGELPAVEWMGGCAASLGGWPQGVLMTTVEQLTQLRDGYLAQARLPRGIPAETMTFDKSLQTWHRLPIVAAAMPDARLIRLRRDPRDMAVSLFLSNMHAGTMGWHASLADIKRVIEAERRHLPAIAAALGVHLLDLRYEDFVADTRGHLERSLAFLGLPWHEECLAPEANARVMMTLSHEQVRRPVNTESIGRWQNYAEHFDASWEALDAL